MLAKLLQSYLKFWAKRYLSRVKPQIIAITGSVGKTSAKEAIFEVMKAQFGGTVRKSIGNLNTETGVPMAILGCSASPTNVWGWLPIILTAPAKAMANSETKWLVLELAADKPGDIKYLTSFVKPQIAVITAIGPSHLKAFGEIERVIEEKTALLWPLALDGWAVLNIDDENVRKASYGGRYHKITYGITQKADVMANKIETEIQNFSGQTKFQIKGRVSLSVVSPTLGQEANVYASLAAAAIGKILEITPIKIKQGLENIRSEKHRMNILKGKNDSIIIDDCYNANPLSMRAALKVLDELEGKRKIAVLGDMKELGKISGEAHKLVGQIAKKVTKNVIGIGPAARGYNAVKYFKNTEAASDYLLKDARVGDILLIKASRSMNFEKIVEALKE